MQSTLNKPLSLTASSTSFTESLSGKLIMTVAASLFVAACAHISFPLPFTPVPLTLSNFAVILVGMVLGPVLGFSSMLLYLAEGAAGLPVFSPHGLGGVAQLLGPTAGFLFSYPLAAAVAGAVTRSTRFSTARFTCGILAGVAASLPIFILGAAWLTHLAHLAPTATWYLAIAPFLPGEIVKISAAAGIYSSLQRWRQR